MAIQVTTKPFAGDMVTYKAATLIDSDTWIQELETSLVARAGLDLRAKLTRTEDSALLSLVDADGKVYATSAGVTKFLPPETAEEPDVRELAASTLRMLLDDEYFGPRLRNRIKAGDERATFASEIERAIAKLEEPEPAEPEDWDDWGEEA
ncbi:hypothetical protein [Amycolatopsis pigmentata]|uniref:Uncharacterized protein n=1 Tax=Amycolatopsis pigmentata TaxID=450801 RepID=A0ABW5G5N7_9PSEU